MVAKKQDSKKPNPENAGTGNVTATGSPADKIEIDPVIVTEKFKKLIDKLAMRKHINETFEARSKYDANTVVPRPQTHGSEIVVKNIFNQLTPKYWIQRLRQQEIQKKIIDET